MSRGERTEASHRGMEYYSNKLTVCYNSSQLEIEWEFGVENQMKAKKQKKLRKNSLLLL